jgi:hypothetical protein
MADGALDSAVSVPPEALDQLGAAPAVAGEEQRHPPQADAAPAGSVGRLRGWVRGEAESVWGVRPSLAEVILVVPFAGTLALALIRLAPGFYDFLTKEDSILEWAQFAFFVLAAVGAGLIARSLYAAGKRGPALAYLVFALGVFFVAGEEISWGQRIFGWGTPGELHEINAQDETTVHNISAIEVGFRLSYLTFGLYGSVVAWIVRRRVENWRRETVNLFVPPLFLGGAFFVLFVHRLAYFLGMRGYAYYRAGEWAEFCLAFALAVFVYLSRRRLRAQAVASPGRS